jgi:hypothetical protein
MFCVCSRLAVWTRSMQPDSTVAFHAPFDWVAELERIFN